MDILKHPQTIKGKITALTASITFLITVITVSLCFLLFQSFLRKNQIQSAEFNLQLVSTTVSSQMKDIIYFSKWCCSNPSILDYLENFKYVEKLPPASRDSQKLRPLALSSFMRLHEEYYNTKSRDYISRVLISPNNRNHYLQLLSPKTAETNKPYAADVVFQEEYFHRLYQADDYQWIGPVSEAFKHVNPAQVFPIVRPIYRGYNSEEIGFLYLSVSASIITDSLSAYPLAQDSRLYLNVGDGQYEIRGDEFVRVDQAFVPLSQVTGMAINPHTAVEKVRYHGKDRTVITFPLDVEGWSLTQILSEQQFNSQKQVYYLLLLGICLLILSLGVLLTLLMNRMIGVPVRQIQRKMDAISLGDFSRDLSIEWNHEIGEIGKGINELSLHVVTLMEKRISDEQQKKELEYQILQSQINPHFLYNALNSIKWMATIQNAPGIGEMTTSLARLMKNVSKGTATLITLREELALVEDYFLIQQYRYAGTISIEYQIASEDLYQCKIHRFSLQPMIENALFHGIEPKGTAGRILVCAGETKSQMGKALKITVTDNGVGMSPEKIERVLQENRENKAEFFQQVGISNVNKRIQYDYGSEYGITIESVLHEYTTMTILLPLIRD